MLFRLQWGLQQWKDSGRTLLPYVPALHPGHSTARSHHSQSGSIFHNSDTGSDHGHGFSYSSSPPVPHVPDTFGAQMLSGDGPPIMEEDDKAPPGPKMPSDMLCMQFSLGLLPLRRQRCLCSFVKHWYLLSLRMGWVHVIHAPLGSRTFIVELHGPLLGSEV
jgi:hypothetical protein